MLRAELGRELAQARVDAQRGVLEARATLLERVFARAREELEGLPLTPGVRARLAERAREALRLVPEGQLRVDCSPGLAALLEQALADVADLRVESQAGLPAGFRVTGAGGAVVVDASFAALLELERPVLAIEVLRRLALESA